MMDLLIVVTAVDISVRVVELLLAHCEGVMLIVKAIILPSLIDLMLQIVMGIIQAEVMRVEVFQQRSKVKARVMVIWELKAYLVMNPEANLILSLTLLMMMAVNILLILLTVKVMTRVAPEQVNPIHLISIHCNHQVLETVKDIMDP
jgi:hypothetical protein